ncbi:hypothetical protein LB505_001157 [Fusarium chuoi]|nr:hypothetical protein LB505_001157 [Fusarium chuoi]
MSHKIPGHGEAILAAQFSPKNSSRLATGSGDKTARIWDTDTGTPKYTLSGHGGWVLAVAWSPDGARLATGICSTLGPRNWKSCRKPLDRTFKVGDQYLLGALSSLERRYTSVSECKQRCNSPDMGCEHWKDRACSIRPQEQCKLCALGRRGSRIQRQSRQDGASMEC